MRLDEIYWPEIGRVLYVRPGTSDRRVFEDCMQGRYHVPPEQITPATVLDLGANIGATTAHYEHMWPDALFAAVEMDAANVEMLSRNCSADVWVGPVAGRLGPRRYDANRYDAESLRLDDDGPDEVVGVTLDSIISHYWVDGCDFVKMDIEGTEWEIFEHETPWAPLVRSLLVELHPFGAPPPPSEPWPEGRDGPSPLVASALRQLSELGFRAVPHVRHPHAVWATR